MTPDPRSTPSLSPAGAAGDEARPAPPVPETLEDTGLDAAFVSDLALKTLYRSGARTGRRLAESLRLPFGLIDGLLLDLQQRHLIEVRRTEGHGRQGYVFDLTGEGRSRAREAMEVGRYVGPAPVPFETYVSWVERQSVRNRQISPSDMRRALAHLVLDASFVDAVGAAVNSGTALFLHGAPGNGKTAVANALAEISGEGIYVPRAVAVDGGAVIQLHDPVYHRPAPARSRADEPGDGAAVGVGGVGADDAAGQRTSILEPPPAHDQRFARVRRPAVTVGGELSMEQLDLREDQQAGVYRAPLQLKANGGVFVVDDFGRQRIPARDLLNRWMVPLEERRDYLDLPTGHKLPVPFDCFLVFSTNLDPTDLVEEAFLRRLRYKVEAMDPTREQYGVVFRRCCEERGLEPPGDAVDRIYRDYYAGDGILPRACHPRDLVALVCDEARYRGEPPVLTPETLERACRTYFLELPAAGEHAAAGPAAGSA